MLLAMTTALALSAAITTADFSPRTVEADGRGAAVAPLTGLTNPALTSFRLRYLDGDHEVRTIAMTPTGAQARGDLRDQNGDDAMSMTATYVGWDFYRAHTVEQECRGTCSIPVVARPSSLAGTKRLVLVGFDVSVKSESDRDRRIRLLSIRPSADERTYRVELRDNSDFAYSVRLEYAWVASGHNGKLTDTATRSGSDRTARIPIGTPNATQTFIAGFSVEFNNGEHNLADLAFERDAARQYYVRFNDANYDDPITAVLDRVWIR